MRETLEKLDFVTGCSVMAKTWSRENRRRHRDEPWSKPAQVERKYSYLSYLE